jgi:acyclic terpene utilization AtuA family protein
MGAPLVIANAGGFWGDRNDALAEQVRGGPVDVVMIDYLAEITMSILRRQKERDQEAGFARDFIPALEPVVDAIAERGILVVTNAGGMNPMACARAVAALFRRAGHRGVKLGVVTGDDVFDKLDALLTQEELRHLDTGAPLASVRDRVLSANVYLGAPPIAEAIKGGAQIVITGRCTDSALALGPLCARFDWPRDDWNRLASGVIAGHVLECGAQASGGNYAGGWPEVPDLANVGYPIAEVSDSGDIVITKHPKLGGCVTAGSVKEQLLYEIGDPRAYHTPDVSADFTSIQLEDLGGDRVRLSGIRGAPPPERLKVSISYHAGFKTVVALTLVWPDAIARARASAELLLERAKKLGLGIEAHRIDFMGVSSAHGPMAPALSEEPNEVLLRLAIRTRDAESARRFGGEIAPLITSGVPGACNGNMRGRPEPSPIVDFWPALVPADTVAPHIEMVES